MDIVEAKQRAMARLPVCYNIPGEKNYSTRLIELARMLDSYTFTVKEYQMIEAEIIGEKKRLRSIREDDLATL